MEVCINFFYDILVYSPYYSSHLDHLRVIL